MKEEKIILQDGSENIKQNLKLLGLEGEYKNQKIDFEGISEIDVLAKQIYQKGDKVLVTASYNFEAQVNYYVVDYARSNWNFWLSAIFVILLLAIGHLKGFRAIIALILSFVILLYYIIPQILNGSDALIVALVGSFLILISIIYSTEGFVARSHLSLISILLACLLH